MALHLYEVAVSGYGAECLYAPSRGRALASAWRSDAFGHVTFGDFLKMAKATRRNDPPADDGYGYVRSRYGVDPRVGQRVTYFGSFDPIGESGTVLYPGRSTASVYVMLDGRESPSWVHPTDLRYDDPLASRSLPHAGRV